MNPTVVVLAVMLAFAVVVAVPDAPFSVAETAEAMCAPLSNCGPLSGCYYVDRTVFCIP